MLKRDLIRHIISLLVGLLLLGVCFQFLLSFYQVKSKDQNAFLKAKEWLVINQLQTPNRFEFVTYRVDKKTYLGRVIGLPDETVAFRDDLLYIDDKIVEENYLNHFKKAHLERNHYQNAFTEDFTLETLTDGAVSRIPKNQFLILNDQRKETTDSREFGLISKAQIKGVASFKFFPFDQFGFLDYR